MEHSRKNMQWKGFEQDPKGKLLRQYVNLDDDLGYAYERAIGFYKDFHIHERLMVVCPRGASVMEVRTRRPKRTYTIDSTSCLIVPSYLEHDDEGKTTVYDTIALFLAPDLLNRCGISEKNFARKDRAYKFKRSAHFENLLNRFIFETLINPSPNPSADLATHLSEELVQLFRGVKELNAAQISTNDNNSTLGTDIESADNISQIAIQYIETHLFEQLDLTQITKTAKTSKATLLRRFKEDFGVTPYAYVRGRRLDEAHALLISSDYTVADVCFLVGYQDLSSFSKAFKARFNLNPSEVGRPHIGGHLKQDKNY